MVIQNNYNYVHFTPLQSIGQSGSPYSIADQLSLEWSTLPEMEEYLWKGRGVFFNIL